MTPPSVFGNLRREHRMVLARLARLERSVAGTTSRGRARAEKEMAQVVRLLERQFATHMSAEARVLFPALLKVLPEAGASIAPLEGEHAELRSILASLRATLRRPWEEGRDEQIAVLARDLVDLLRIHIRKEESVIFRVAERVLPAREVARLEAWRSRKAKRSTPRPESGRSKGER
ncbi:MAG TPA: hemerythrin domain-containing protein [Candidatus Eisenbacteria bacterium]